MQVVVGSRRRTRRRARSRALLSALAAALLACGLLPASSAVAGAQGGHGGRPAVVLTPVRAPSPSALTDKCTSWPGGLCASEKPGVQFSVFNNGDTSGCTFSVTSSWGDGTTTTKNVSGGPDGTSTVGGAHQYDGKVRPKEYAISVTGAVTAGSCSFFGGTLTFRLVCGPPDLANAAWAGRFPGGRDTTTLRAPFQGAADSFIGAMEAAGISVRVIATFRPAQRAYMMHYSWLVARGDVSPDAVPAFVPQAGEAPINICWVYPDATTGATDQTASVAGATALRDALGIDPTLAVAPAERSRHTEGAAIDMATTWATPTVTVNDASGTPVVINTTPHSGMNSQLWAIGAGYGVTHFVGGAADRNHWSDTGH